MSYIQRTLNAEMFSPFSQRHRNYNSLVQNALQPHQDVRSKSPSRLLFIFGRFLHKTLLLVFIGSSDYTLQSSYMAFLF